MNDLLCGFLVFGVKEEIVGKCGLHLSEVNCYFAAKNNGFEFNRISSKNQPYGCQRNTTNKKIERILYNSDKTSSVSCSSSKPCLCEG